MSANRMSYRNRPEEQQDEASPGVEMPLFMNTRGENILTILLRESQLKTFLHAELIFAARGGPCPPGHIIRFKDGDRRNRDFDNLEWVPNATTAPDGDVR